MWGFTTDLRTVETTLHGDPTDWGDPLYDTNPLQMTHYRGKSHCLYVYFAVHHHQNEVFIQKVEVNPYGPFAGFDPGQ